MARVAVVFFEGKNRQKTLDIAKHLAQGIETQGHHVDVVDGDHDVNTKLTGHQYLAVGTSAINFFGGKIPDTVSRFLANAGIVAGKRSFAFAVKGGLRMHKTLGAIMKAMEKEGMFLKFSDVLTSPAEAAAIGKRLHVE
jgi:hypothetical protein